MEKIFIGALTRNGNKERARNIFFTAMSYLTTKYPKKSPNDLLTEVFDKVSPVLTYSIVRRGITKYYYPRRANDRYCRSVTARWIVQSAKLRSEYDMGKKLFGELDDTLLGRSRSISKSIEFQKKAVSNRFALKVKFNKSYVRKSNANLEMYNDLFCCFDCRDYTCLIMQMCWFI